MPPFRNTAHIPLILLLGQLLASCGTPPEAGHPATSPPNLLLITIETFRADHAQVNGYSRQTTPNLLQLGRQGAIFNQAIAQAPFTLPSLATVMTGLTPPAHGVRNHPAALRPELVTLAERLTASGYQTVAMTRHSWLRRKSGFDQGFSEYHNNKFSAGLDARSLSLAASDWLRADGEKPFFLWLHFIDPHLPYTPGYPYSVLYHPEHLQDSQVKHLRRLIATQTDGFAPTPYADLSGGPYLDLVMRYYPKNPVLLDLALRRRPRGEIFFGQARYPADAIQQVRDLYDGAVVYTDDNVGRILGVLDELGLTENTLVAVLGDHGEALGEHDLFFTHDFSLYDEVLRVPLVLRMPGRIPPGTIVDQQVRLMDLTPTVLDLLGVGAEAPDAQMEGVSLAPLLEHRSLPFLPAFAEAAPYRRLFPEQTRVYYQGNRGKWRMVRTERWKLILIPHPKGDRFELYDLQSDPDELRNLYDELPGEAGKLWPLLQAWLAEDPDRDVDRSTEEERALEALDPAARQQLETLGYIN
jgi:arylsulfatase A-like enzyme